MAERKVPRNANMTIAPKLLKNGFCNLEGEDVGGSARDESTKNTATRIQTHDYDT